MPELQTRYAAQLHVVPTYLTFFEFMNTTTAPFTDPNVRRAVDLATDREAVIAAYGGPLSGRVTCQSIPPGFPGYVPYCPDTIAPNPEGTWTAPDLATARDLIAKSGLAGTPVDVTEADTPGFREVGQYFVSLLDQLGFAATEKLLPFDDFFAAVGSTSTSTFQMTGYWFSQPNPDPAEVFLGTLTCPGFAAAGDLDDNSSHFCDPAIDQRILDGIATSATDPTAADGIWAEIDHRITDETPFVAAFNPTEIDLVSQRVGGFQVHPLLGLMLDQLWVR